MATQATDGARLYNRAVKSERVITPEPSLPATAPTSPARATPATARAARPAAATGRAPASAAASPQPRLRDTFATRLKEAGVDPVTRRDLLGHASTVMTDSYTHSAAETKQSAVDSIYPPANPSPLQFPAKAEQPPGEGGPRAEQKGADAAGTPYTVPARLREIA